MLWCAVGQLFCAFIGFSEGRLYQILGWRRWSHVFEHGSSLAQPL